MICTHAVLSTGNDVETLNPNLSQDAGEPEESEESDDSSCDQSNTDYSCESDDDKEANDERNHSNTSSNCTSGSENTTHSYPSSLLEEEDDMHLMPNLDKLNLSPSLSDLNNGNGMNGNVLERERIYKRKRNFCCFRELQNGVNK